MRYILIYLIFGFFGFQSSYAFSQKASIINNIVVEGTRRIDDATVKSYLLLQPGDKMDAARVDQSLKSLFATGLFADVVIDFVSPKLIIRVTENPVINRIAFEGNKRIEDEDLEKEVILRPRVVYTRTKVQADVKRLLDLYNSSGRYAASIVPKVIQRPQNRADLIFEIDEGPLTKVEGISFIGNKFKSDKNLRSVIRTKVAAWYRFFSSDDTYNADRLAVDRELLRRFYFSHGFIDFQITSAVAELAPDGSAFFLTFSLLEGARYKIGDVNVRASLKGMNSSELISLIDLNRGETYDSRKVDKAITKLSEAAANQGFAFVEVRPKIERNSKDQIASIIFDINEGPRVFIERIDIAGNVRTVDEVLRREFDLVEGDAFNARKLRKSRRKIQDLNFFNKVDIKNVQGSDADKTIIQVEVEEKSTGSVSFGAGFSTDNGPLLDLGIREQNLLGKGQRLNFNGTLAAERSTVSISFTEPYFLDRDVLGGFDIYRIIQSNQVSSSFDSRETGLGLRVGYSVTNEVRQNWRYKAEASSIENVSSSASNLIKAQEGNRFLSEVGHSLFYDKRNSRSNPTDGFILKTFNDFAGLGGSVKYFRNKLEGAQFFEVFDKWIISSRGLAGYIFGIGGDEIGISDRFSLGGNNLRGFEKGGVGPRDISTDDALGGEWMYAGTLETNFPLGLPDELALSGRLFTDFGSIGSVSPSNVNIQDTGNIRVSLGGGIGWVSPFGPITIDIGYPLKKESFDKTERVRFNFGTRF